MWVSQDMLQAPVAYVTHGSLHTIDKSAQLVMVDVVVHRPLDISFCRLLQLQ